MWSDRLQVTRRKLPYLAPVDSLVELTPLPHHHHRCPESRIKDPLDSEGLSDQPVRSSVSADPEIGKKENQC